VLGVFIYLSTEKFTNNLLNLSEEKS